MKIFVAPEMEINVIEIADVITTSTVNVNPCNQDYSLPEI